MSFYHSQTHSLGKVMVTKVVVAFGTSDIYCGLSSLGAGMVMVDSQNQHPWECLLGGSSLMVKPKGLLGKQIYMWTPQPSCLYTAV